MRGKRIASSLFNFWLRVRNLIYLAIEKLSDSVEFVGAIRINIYLSTTTLRICEDVKQGVPGIDVASMDGVKRRLDCYARRTALCGVDTRRQSTTGLSSSPALAACQLARGWSRAGRAPADDAGISSYDTIRQRDASLTCARKPTQVSLIS